MIFRRGKTTIKENRIKLGAPRSAEVIILIRCHGARLHAFEVPGPMARLGARQGNPSSGLVGKCVDMTCLPVAIQQLDIPSERSRPPSIALREEVKREEEGDLTAGKDTRQKAKAHKAEPWGHTGQVSAGHDLLNGMPVTSGVTVRQAQSAPVPRGERGLHLVILARSQAVPGTKGMARREVARDSTKTSLALAESALREQTVLRRAAMA